MRLDQYARTIHDGSGTGKGKGMKQALDDAMIAKLLEAAAIVGRERPAEDAGRISAAVVATADRARDGYRLDTTDRLDLADAAMATLDASADAEDGEL
jgi:hypothetical protein